MKLTGVLTLFTAVCAVAACEADDFTLDFSRELGKIRRLNGLCNTARINNSRDGDQLHEFTALETPCVRYHDAALENPGFALVDVSRIFPLMHLDPDDPRNYDFRATDDYVKRTLATGAEVEFRLGESIEHSKNLYRVHAPKDIAKYARVCLNIVRHYNSGWADGYRFNIRRWSIWEEPDLRHLFFCEDGKPLDVYCRLYEAVARAIKAEFPHVLVGGPQDTGDTAFREGFVRYCAEKKVPLDFVMFDCYLRHPESLFSRVKWTREMMDRHGFKKARLGVAEWHYGPIAWNIFWSQDPASVRAVKDLTGIDSAVYASSVLSRFQDSPVDDMFYYAANTSIWGLFYSGRKLPVWHVFKAFATMAAKGEAVRVDVPARIGDNRYVLASKHGGKGYLMVSNFRIAKDCFFNVKDAGKPVSVKVLGNGQGLEKTTRWNWTADGKGGGRIRLTAPESCSSAMWLVEFDLK